MKANPANIWSVPAYLPYLQPPLTPAMVAEAEGRIGHKLPAEYLALLETQNGGYIRFGLDGKSHDFIRGIGPNSPSITDLAWHPEVRDNVSFPLDGLVPFDGDGHWYLCLDYRTHAEAPGIIHVDVECDGQERIADSFAGYLDALEPEFLQHFDWFVAPAVADFPAMKARLEKALGKAFDLESGDLESGVFTLVARIGKSPKQRRTFTMQPNRTSRGRIRTNHPQYEELKNLLPGSAPRYPELPPESYLFFAMSESQDTLRAACETASVEIHSLPEYMAQLTSRKGSS